MEIMKHCAHTKYAADHLNLLWRNFVSSKTSNHRNQCLCNDNLIINFFPAAAPGVPCPDCDELLNCVWGRQCPDEHTCMTRSYPNYNFKVHCSVVRYFIFKCLSYLSDEICDKDDTTCSQVSHERNDF